MTEQEVKAALEGLEYDEDIRLPPDAYRRGWFLSGWEDASVRGQRYTLETLKDLSWRNVGYQMGRHFGVQSKDAMERTLDVLAGMYYPLNLYVNWRSSVHRWLQGAQAFPANLYTDAVKFFERAFQNVRLPERTWFEIHRHAVRLVVG